MGAPKAYLIAIPDVYTPSCYLLILVVNFIVKSLLAVTGQILATRLLMFQGSTLTRVLPHGRLGTHF